MWIVFVLGTVTTRVDAQFERYAVEFVGRVNLAAYPAAVVLAARAAAAIGPPGPAGLRGWLVQAAVGLLVCARGWLGISAWLVWMR
jgi:hypothetical protein